MLAKSYTTALKDAGFSVAHSVSAQGAITACDKQQPDVVVVELQIPRHSGLEFLYELKSYPDWQNIPVVVLSGIARAEIGNDHALKHLNVCNFLYKPKAKLSQIVRAVELAT